MIFYPAIDIINGKCVRLSQGMLEHKKIYDVEPLDQIKNYEKEGANWVHVVDFRRCVFWKSKKSKKKIIELANITNCNLQVGGGIRSLETISKLISNGVKRVVLGTVAVQNPDFVIDACKEFPEKIALGIDSKYNKVSIEGWTKSENISDIDLINKFEDAGVSHIIFTDISRDGRMIGPNIKKLKIF